MEDFQALAKKIRRTILKASYEANACHLGSALSCVEILLEIYSRLREGDFFIFSKASGVAALYAVLAERGVIPEDKVAYYLKKFPLPSKEVPGVLYSGGSLGHGLPAACGLALADRSKKVYVLMSDAELQEGTTWESAEFAAEHKLENLIVIVDWNGWQACKKTKGKERIADKWGAFGWATGEACGHDRLYVQVRLAQLDGFPLPKVIIANTIKGKGVSFLEDTLESHYHNLTKEEYETSIRENT